MTRVKGEEMNEGRSKVESGGYSCAVPCGRRRLQSKPLTAHKCSLNCTSNAYA